MAEKKTTSKQEGEKPTLAQKKQEGKKEEKKMTLAQKMLELQKSVRSLTKDADNKAFKYSYISGSKLFGVIRPKMDELGLTLTQTFIPESVQINGSSIYMILRFIWCDTATGETKEDLWPAAGQNSTLDKAIGSLMTYGERYYCLKQLHLPSDEDDADAIETEPKKPTIEEVKKAVDNLHATQPQPQQRTKAAIWMAECVDRYVKGLTSNGVDYRTAWINNSKPTEAEIKEFDKMVETEQAKYV